MYGKYKGTLMIAMGCDGNNQLFPLAFAIAESENTDSWSWFLACIRAGVTQRKGLCLISDRHPGRREHGESRLASGEEFTPYIDVKIKTKVVKAGSHEVLLYDHMQGLFHVKARRFVGSNNRKPRTYHVNLRTGSCTCTKTLLLGFPCSHILDTYHCRSIDFRQFVHSYYTIRCYLSTWAPLFYPIFDESDWPQYNGAVIVPSDSMKRATSGRPKSSRLHNEMDAKEAKTQQACGLCKQLGHN